MKYEPHILALQTFDGFEKKFIEFIPYYQTYELAYEAAERMHVRHYNKRKFKDYNSFRVARAYYKKKYKKND